MQFAHLKNKVEDVESVVKKWIYVDEVRLHETGDFFGFSYREIWNNRDIDFRGG